MKNDQIEPSCKYGAIIPQADMKLYERCLKTASDIYGKNLSTILSMRLADELEAIIKNNFASDYLLAAELADYSKEAGYPVSFRGKIGSTLTAYLSGISLVNPLPAHYICPDCHNVEFIDEKEPDYRVYGYDYNDKPCPVCNGMMKAVGANCMSEVCMGIDLKKAPDISLNFAEEIRPQIIDHIKTRFGRDNVFRAGVSRTRKDGSINKGVHPGGLFIMSDGCNIEEFTALRPYERTDVNQLQITDTDYSELYDVLNKYDIFLHNTLDMIHTLESITGISSVDIPYNDKDVLNVFIEEGTGFIPSAEKIIEYRKYAEAFEHSINSLVPPHCFSDIARISGLQHGSGTWFDNAELLIKEGKNLKDILYCRDDIMLYLMENGIAKRQAYSVMQHVSSGKGLTSEMIRIMTDAGVPEWYIDSCNKIKYLFPKVHIANYAMINWILAWYKLNYPEEYEMACLMVDR